MTTKIFKLRHNHSALAFYPHRQLASLINQVEEVSQYLCPSCGCDFVNKMHDGEEIGKLFFRVVATQTH